MIKNLWKLACFVLAMTFMHTAPAMAGVIGDTARCTVWVREHAVLNGRVGITEAEAMRLRPGFRYQRPDGNWRELGPGGHFWGDCRSFVSAGGRVSDAGQQTTEAPAPTPTIAPAPPAAAPVVQTPAPVAEAPAQTTEPVAEPAVAPSAATPMEDLRQTYNDARAGLSWVQNWAADATRAVLGWLGSLAIGFLIGLASFLAWLIQWWWVILLALVLLYLVVVTLMCRFAPSLFKKCFSALLVDPDELNAIGMWTMIICLGITLSVVNKLWREFFEVQYGNLLYADQFETAAGKHAWLDSEGKRRATPFREVANDPLDRFDPRPPTEFEARQREEPRWQTG